MENRQFPGDLPIQILIFHSKLLVYQEGKVWKSHGFKLQNLAFRRRLGAWKIPWIFKAWRISANTWPLGEIARLKAQGHG